jgi:hypothetical protein
MSQNVKSAQKHLSLRRAISKRSFLLFTLAAGLIIGNRAPAQFTNGGFEIGPPGVPPPPWVVSTYMNYAGFNVQSPQTDEGLNLVDGGIALTEVTNSPGGLDSAPDADLGTNASLRWPRYGYQCALINDNGRDYNVNSLSQSAIVGGGMIDPIDGQVHVTFVIAPVLENPYHETNAQPYYFIQLSDDTQDIILYSDFGGLYDLDMPWQRDVVTNVTEYDFTDWQMVDIVPGTNVAMGDQITLTAMASGCALGGHMGQLYIDGVGSSIDGIYMTGATAQAAMSGGNLAYKLTYRNGSPSAETGVVLCFNTPRNTTFQSLDAPGLAAVPPQVGTSGLVLCTLTNLEAGASGSFSVTVNINPGTIGAITARNYYIYSDLETPLLGPRLSTVVLNPILLCGPAVSGDGGLLFTFTNVPGTCFTVVSTTNVSLPFSQWAVLGGAVENTPGNYSFTDTVTNQERFYGVRSP